MNKSLLSSPQSIQQQIAGDDDCPPDLLSPRPTSPEEIEPVKLYNKDKYSDNQNEHQDVKGGQFDKVQDQQPQSLVIRSPRCLDQEKFDDFCTTSFLTADTIQQLKLDRNILSNQIPYFSRSFLKGGPYQKYNPKFPPPTCLDYERIKKTRDLDIRDIMNGIVIPDKGGFQCVDADVLSRQKGLMTDVIKQVIVCVLKRQPISGISLPVRVFEPRSQIERMLDIFGFAPIFFKKAAMTSDKLQRLKLVITNVVAGMYGSAKQLKPFNPLLGETYQGYFQDGTRIFCEHTSHHPPISNFLIEGPIIEETKNEETKIGEQSKESTMNKRLWKLSGFYQFTGEKDGDSFKVGQKGPNRLIFHDGHKIQWINPVFKLSISGSRYMNYTGDITFYDEQNRVKATIILDHTKEKSWIGSTKRSGKTDDFTGIIYNIKQDAFKSQGFHEKKIYDWKHPSKIKDIKDIQGDPICRIEGSWLRNITFDSKEYWKMLDPTFKPHPQRGSKCPLPSDWRFRQDLIWLKYKNEQFADAWKKELEKMQRLDRKWRSKRRPR